jgi:enamine deaminase RidA (YjgF/YER057c/UK114 family)
MTAEETLAQLGLALPASVAPVANYVPFVRSGSLLFVSGQIPLKDGAQLTPGIVGSTVTVEEAQLAARQCGLNILSQVKAATGSLDTVQRIVKLGAFIACPSDFSQQPEVANGASDLMVAVFGDAGRHARSAVGSSSLPRGACVEIDAIIELKA